LKYILRDIATVRTGLVLSRKKAKPMSSSVHRYEQVSIRCFGSPIRLDREYTEIFEADKAVDERYLTREGDVLVRLRAPATAVYVGNDAEGLLVSSLLAVIRVSDENILPKFLAHYLNSETAQHLLRRDIKGTTIPMLKTRDLDELKIVIPPLEIQKRLVTYLNASQKEQELLRKLMDQKQSFSKAIFETILEQNKDTAR